jgi:MFS transporter, DHA1 family, inner membrane transport protein
MDRATPHKTRPTLVLLALAMGGFAIGTTEFATMSLLPYMAAGLHIDEPTAGHVISAYAIGVVIGAPLLAVLTARVARRTLLLLLMLIFTAGNALSALAPTYGWMLAFRFLSGLPHGAYFGVGALVAASLVPVQKRTSAVTKMMLGLTLATVLGVPLANFLGQEAGWRWGFGVVACLGMTTLVLLALFAPGGDTSAGASPLRELGALRLPQVWLTLGIGAIGFGGLFCVYSYLASTLLAVTHAAPHVIPPVPCVFGVGMFLGNLLVPYAADRALMPTAGAILLLMVMALLLYPLAARNIWLISADVFVVGTGVALGAVLQIRLMDVAGDAQSLAAALNHSAFNTANALGPWLGGLAIHAGWGWTSTGPVGAALAAGGLLIWSIARRGARASTGRREVALAGYRSP